jgi:hypothetical protein
MNEMICATALYYLDSKNITASNLTFRMQTSEEAYEKYYTEQDGVSCLEGIYGTCLDGDSPFIQKYGTIGTPEGRLLAFPNVL